MNIINIYGFAVPIVLSIVCILICRKLLSSAKDTEQKRLAIVLSVIILVWFVITLLFSLNGFFKNLNQYSENDIFGLMQIIVIMFIPIIIFCILFFKNKTFRILLKSIKLKSLILIQMYRFLGTIFLFLGFQQQMPLLFALPPGILDVSVAILAIIISSRQSYIRKFSKAWNYLGLFDFVLAFSIFFMYFPFRILNAPAARILITGFHPIALIIMVLVPLAVILHILALSKLKELE